jgi:23S rRNA (cytidine1920-2'-O)/16S rRNA (cytidine1409-2'-O)-methyltransferase
VLAPAVTRRRLDAELVRRGLATSRAEAQEAVRAGLVRVGGLTATKPATLVAEDAPVLVTSPVRPYVSRGGAKLAAALERFALDPTGAECLDAGASTGGFTDCLLRAGAARVVAVDVGRGQLAWELRNDPRVVVLERTNVRDLTPGSLPFVPGFVVADLSFISLRLTLPRLAAVTAAGATYVVLVKPQFEARPQDVGSGGVVRDPAVWRRVLGSVRDTASGVGLGVRGAMPSPLPGPAGNVEFLLHLAAGVPLEPVDLDVVVTDGEAVLA